jgi:nucleoside-diphosphate-sugar epimerase
VRVVDALQLAGVDDVHGVARRAAASMSAVTWSECDLAEPSASQVLVDAFRGADAVIHLGWQIQPGRDLQRMHDTNVAGSRRVVEAVVAAGVPALLYASSVGAYSRGPKDHAVDETWPTDGTPSSTYARHKAAVERILDDVEAAYPALRIVRFRPGLIFQGDAGSEIARYFLGPFLPLSALHPKLLPVLPTFDRLTFQAVHTEDVARAFAAATLDESARGAYNLAAEPVLDSEQLARALRARPVPVPFSLLRIANDIAFRARLIPTDAGWLDLAAAVPVMSTTRARDELGWTPRRSSTDALLELLDGMRTHTGRSTPPLHAEGGALRRLVSAGRTAMRGGPGTEND